MKNSNFGEQNVYYNKRVLWTIDRFVDSGGKKATYTSIPTLLQTAQTSVDEILYKHLYIRVHDPEDYELIDEIGAALKSATDIDPFLQYKGKQSTDGIKRVINSVFFVIIAIMMFLCFFSLSASMSANLYE